jgi:hypothetical protein
MSSKKAPTAGGYLEVWKQGPDGEHTKGVQPKVIVAVWITKVKKKPPAQQ